MMDAASIEKYVTSKYPEIKMRQRIEIEICHAVVVAAIAAGYTIRVDQGNCGDLEPMRTTVDEVMGDLFACDDDRIYLYTSYVTGDDQRFTTLDLATAHASEVFNSTGHVIAIEQKSRRFGWVYFVFGNDGWDVINDYTTNLESLMQGEVARLQELYG